MFDNLAQKQERLDIGFDLLLLPNKLFQNLVAQNKQLLSSFTVSYVENLGLVQVVPPAQALSCGCSQASGQGFDFI